MESSVPKIMKTTLQAEGLLQCRITIDAQVHPDAPSDENCGCKSCSVSRMGKARDDPRWKGFHKIHFIERKTSQGIYVIR